MVTVCLEAENQQRNQPRLHTLHVQPVTWTMPSSSSSNLLHFLHPLDQNNIIIYSLSRTLHRPSNNSSSCCTTPHLPSSFKILGLLLKPCALHFDILIIMNLGGPPTGTSFLDLLRNFETNPSNVPLPLPNDNTFEADNDFGFDEPNSQYSEDTDIESMCNIENDSEDVSEPPVVNFMNDIGDVGDDDIVDLENNIHIDVWSESENKIRLCHFLTLIIGWSRIGKLKQITRDFLCIKVGGV